jgi:hypothetical protein
MKNMALNPALAKMISGATNKYKGAGGKALKPKEGRNTYRLLVDPNSTDQFWADQAVHWIKPDENAKPIAVVGDCDVVYQRPSVINAAIEMAVNSAHDDVSKKLFESWKSRKSVILPVIERPKTDEAELLELTPTTFGKVLDLIQLYMDSGQNIIDAEAGLDIVITRSGKGLNTEYDVAVAPGAPKAVPAAVFTNLPDPLAYIEREYFRGEEQKALNAIAQIAGVAVPKLGAPSHVSTPTAALTSAAATVAPAAAPVTPAPAPVHVAEAANAVVDEAAARREALLKRQAEMAAELAAMELEAAPAAPVAPAAAVAETPAVAGLSVSEQDAILAELDGLK